MSYVPKWGEQHLVQLICLLYLPVGKVLSNIYVGSIIKLVFGKRAHIAKPNIPQVSDGHAWIMTRHGLRPHRYEGKYQLQHIHDAQESDSDSSDSSDVDLLSDVGIESDLDTANDYE